MPKKNPRIPRKKGQRKNSRKHSDLFTDENPVGTIKGLKFATVKDSETSVNKIKRSGKSHNHKTQAAIAMEQRAESMGKKSSAAVFRKFIEDQKEITKEKNKKKNEAIANKKNLFLDRPSTHDRYDKPVTDQIYDYLKDMKLAEAYLRKYVRSFLKEEKNVLGYIKPTESFFLLSEWEMFCNKVLELQRKGFDTRGGGITLNSDLINLVNKFFDYQLNFEVNQYDLLTYKNVMDFIEDFANHRFWGIKKEFGHYFPDINKLKFAYFYSRGDIEPYALIDEEFTTQLYGSVYNPKELMHYTSREGADRLSKAIATGNSNFDISSFTVAYRPFFRKDSNHIVKFIGNVRAGFRSDIKSFATTSGRRAVNLYRLEYPGRDLNNICYELESCDGELKTSLWNEYIATPIKIISIEKIK